MKAIKIIVLAFLLVLTLQTVFAFGVSPGRTTVMYNNVDKEFFFTVFNSGGKEMDLTFSTSGELGKYIVLDTKKAIMSANEESKMFRFTLDVDKEFEKIGMYGGKITINEAGESEGGFGVSLSIATQVALKVTDSSINLRGEKLPADSKLSLEEIPLFYAVFFILLLIGLVLITFKRLINKNDTY